VTGAAPALPGEQWRVRHFTATGYVVNPSRTRMLLIRHRKLGLWLPPGGQRLSRDAAIREVLEQTGVTPRLLPPAESPRPAPGS